MSAAFRYHTETIAGVEIQKPLPKKLHAIVQLHLLILLERMLSEQKKYSVLPELNVICAGERIVPDVVVYESNAVFEDGDLIQPPVLAIEIASPGQPFSNLLSKCERLIATGTSVCWIVLPEKRQVWTFSLASGLERAGEVLEVSSVPIQIELADLWIRLDRSA